MEYYKTLDASGVSPYANVQYSLPHDGKPGEWMPYVKGKLIKCSHGYHIVTRDQLVGWIDARIFPVETKGTVVDWDDKHGTHQIRLVSEYTRWNKRTQRLFTCDCVEHVLRLFEKEYPNDTRPRNAIKTSRRFANGCATKKELEKAAQTAYAAHINNATASATVKAIAYATDTACANYTAEAAAYAAYAAAYATTRPTRAAKDFDRERKWQTRQLFRYLEGK